MEALEGRILVTACSLIIIVGVAHGAPAPQPDSFSVPFSEQSPTAHPKQTYRLCFTYKADGKTFDRDDKECSTQTYSPVEQLPLQAGKNLLVVIDAVPLKTACDSFKLSLTKHPVTAVDENPVRGQTPTKQASALPKSVTELSPTRYLVLLGGECYATYPDPLNADTYTTVTVTAAPAPAPAPAPTPTPKTVVDAYPLPEIHTFYKFGISTGVAVSTVASKTFAYTAGSGTSTFGLRTSSSTPVVEPVLFLAYYLDGGLDTEAEANWRKDFGLAAGLSEKNPTSSFYLGFYDEPIRNIDFIIGVNATQESELDYNSYDPGATATHLTPPTRAEYKYGAFLCVSFSFLNFLQQVFK